VTCVPRTDCTDIKKQCFGSTRCGEHEEIFHPVGETRVDSDTGKSCYEPACPACRPLLKRKKKNCKACVKDLQCSEHEHVTQPYEPVSSETGCKNCPFCEVRRSFVCYFHVKIFPHLQRTCPDLNCDNKPCTPIGEIPIPGISPDGCPLYCPVCKLGCPKLKCRVPHCTGNTEVHYPMVNGCRTCGYADLIFDGFFF
jgi:hypothetical protein